MCWFLRVLGGWLDEMLHCVGVLRSPLAFAGAGGSIVSKIISPWYMNHGGTRYSNEMMSIHHQLSFALPPWPIYDATLRSRNVSDLCEELCGAHTVKGTPFSNPKSQDHRPSSNHPHKNHTLYLLPI